MQGRDTAVYFTPTSVYYSLRQYAKEWTVELELLNASQDVRVRAGEPTGAVVSYFHGSPEQWKTGIPTFSSILYQDVWPGIDVAFTGQAGNLKYTFLVTRGPISATGASRREGVFRPATGR